MKYFTFALLVAAVSASKLSVDHQHQHQHKHRKSHIGASFDPNFLGGDKPKTYMWEKDLSKSHGAKTQAQVDAEWDGDLGFDITIGG